MLLSKLWLICIYYTVYYKYSFYALRLFSIHPSVISHCFSSPLPPEAWSPQQPTLGENQEINWTSSHFIVCPTRRETNSYSCSKSHVSPLRSHAICFCTVGGSWEHACSTWKGPRTGLEPRTVLVWSNGATTELCVLLAVILMHRFYL